MPIAYYSRALRMHRAAAPRMSQMPGRTQNQLLGCVVSVRHRIARRSAVRGVDAFIRQIEFENRISKLVFQGLTRDRAEDMTTDGNCNEPVTVFLDRNVRARSVIVQGAAERRKVQWGPKIHEVEIGGWIKTPPRQGDGKWMEDELVCLPTIARLAKQRVITLFESNAVRVESWLAGSGARGTRGDIFAGVDIRQMADAVNRSYFRSGMIDRVVDRKEVIEFCRFLRQITPQMLEGSGGAFQRLPAQMQANIRGIDRFHVLTDVLQAERQWLDALHLWSAETHGANYFLTFDRKFINALTKSAHVNLPTKPVLPSELLEDLRIQDRNSGLIEDNRFYSMLDI